MAEPRPSGGPPLIVSRHGGLTLTELLVAAALSLVVMAAVATLFSVFGRSVRQSQATVQMSSLMRSAAWQLRQDLAGATCRPLPWVSPETNSGYFELIEGPARDTTYALDDQKTPTDNLTADTDDVLLFTTQALAGPFVGQFDGGLVESPYAEVAWFCRPSATQPVPGTTLYDLHRRQLLLVNYLGRSDLVSNALPISLDRATNGLSLRPATLSGQGSVLLPNSLGDVTKREHRFMRAGYAYRTASGQLRQVPPQPFPHAFPVDPETHLVIPEAACEGAVREHEDIVLTSVIAFDVRVFDPQAIVTRGDDTRWRFPGDPGYQAGPVAAAGDGLGAYVDLASHGGTPGLPTAPFPPPGISALQSPGVRVTNLPRKLALPSVTYDTWSRHYELNGIDDDGDGLTDEGVAGTDVTGDGWSELTGDAETSPPYPVPLRGLEIRIRCYEPNSRQVRQVTVRHSFSH